MDIMKDVDVGQTEKEHQYLLQTTQKTIKLLDELTKDIQEFTEQMRKRREELILKAESDCQVINLMRDSFKKILTE